MPESWGMWRIVMEHGGGMLWNVTVSVETWHKVGKCVRERKEVVKRLSEMLKSFVP